MPKGRCKLCLLTKDLQNSHLMPASLYKKTRNPAARNPNPAVITGKRTRLRPSSIAPILALGEYKAKVNFFFCHFLASSVS